MSFDKNTQNVVNTTSAYKVAEEETEKARRIVCANAKDAEEATVLLELLGLK